MPFEEFADLRQVIKAWENLATEVTVNAADYAIGIDEKFARLMAGHGSHGFQDRYVQRNPAIVKPACEAVHRAYFG